MTVQITEIIRRSEQGMTQPYICRADDGKTYFVKGIGATRRSQVLEWIVGNLGLQLGLKVAPFEIVNVPEELIENSIGINTFELGVGPAFGSCNQTITELAYSQIDSIPVQTQLDVLAFDWWVRNEDRKLTENGGNPNLFWSPESEELLVIDHNQACDLGFSADEFLGYHVFRHNACQLFSDLELRNTYNQRFNTALQNWNEICHQIPAEWSYADREMTVPANYNLDEIFEVLNRHTQDVFWNTP